MRAGVSWPWPLALYPRVRIAQQPQSQPAIQLPVAVDGSVTPGQIPDSLAYQHFFAAIAAHPFPSQQESARQSAQLSPLGLSAEDRQTLIAGLASFRTQLDQINTARAGITPGPNSSAQLTSLRTQETALVASTLQAIRQSLSTDGVSRLDQYVRTHVKARIKIYGGMQ